MKSLPIIATALLILLLEAHAEPNAAPYQLQERCGKRAEELFLKDSGRGPTANVQSHYNARLKKCFVIERGSAEAVRSGVLFDANENKEYGSYLYSYNKEGNSYTKAAGWCSVAETTCASEPEWDALVKPYMEE